MEGPTTVRLQRRRHELPPDKLFVERKGGKRKFHESVDEGALYIRQNRGKDTSAGQAEFANAPDKTQNEPPTRPTLETRRTFHLKQPSGQDTKSRKRKQDDDSLATFVEKRHEKRQRNTDGDTPTTSSLHEIDEGPKESTPSAPLKRPGRGSAIDPRNKSKPAHSEMESVSARQQREMAALAEEMHQFALAELAKTPKPEIKTKPKLTPSRSRALHNKQNSASQPASQTKDAEDDSMIDSDGEYVYDTYVLAPAPQPVPTPIDANNPVETTKTLAIPSNVGYLIITEDDEDLWETYIHDLEGSDSEPTDEDDENGTFQLCPHTSPCPTCHTNNQSQPKTTTAPTTPRTSSPQTTNSTAVAQRTATAPAAVPTTNNTTSTTTTKTKSPGATKKTCA